MARRSTTQYLKEIEGLFHAKAKRISLFLCLILASGCATTAQRHPFESRSFQIEGVDYLPLSSIAKLNDMHLSLDRTTQKAILENARLRLRLRAGSPVVMANDETEVLDHPVLFHHGVLIVPSSLSRLLSKYMAREKVELVPRVPYRIQTVVVDAGHGGYDPGAIGRTGAKEKNINLDIAKRLKWQLEGRGVHVLMTRGDDHFISLYQRTYIANRAKADFFVSIHCNASRNRRIDGFEVYHLSGSGGGGRAEASPLEAPIEEGMSDPSTASVKATVWGLMYTEHRAESVELARSILSAMGQKLSSPSRGVKSARFFVLKGTRMPAVLVEVGYLTNRKEESRLKQKSYRQEIAEALAAGVLAYKDEFERTNGFTN